MPCRFIHSQDSSPLPRCLDDDATERCETNVGQDAFVIRPVCHHRNDSPRDGTSFARRPAREIEGSPLPHNPHSLFTKSVRHVSCARWRLCTLTEKRHPARDAFHAQAAPKSPSRLQNELMQLFLAAKNSGHVVETSAQEDLKDSSPSLKIFRSKPRNVGETAG